MMSIKEQADYLYQGYGTNPNRKALRGNFIQGANYVLREIEKLLDEFSNFEDSLIIRRVIEQLKK